MRHLLNEKETYNLGGERNRVLCLELTVRLWIAQYHLSPETLLLAEDPAGLDSKLWAVLALASCAFILGLRRKGSQPFGEVILTVESKRAIPAL